MSNNIQEYFSVLKKPMVNISYAALKSMIIYLKPKMFNG